MLLLDTVLLVLVMVVPFGVLAGASLLLDGHSDSEVSEYTPRGHF